MLQNVVYGLSALVALLPASLAALIRARRAPDADGRAADPLFWPLLAVAAAGAATSSVAQLDGAWRTGLSATLWVSISACLLLYAGICAADAAARRLAPLLLPYLATLGLFAVLTSGAQAPGLRGAAPAVWIDLHIAVSVLTYALLTLGAVAALAAFLQERALKAKRPTALTRQLPPLAHADRLQVRLLGASEAVLGLGLLTGMAVLYLETGSPLAFDHKTLFSFATFLVIGALLVAHAASGVRGRRAGRLVLLAYLLLTLGFPGVKFVTGVLLG